MNARDFQPKGLCSSLTSKIRKELVTESDERLLRMALSADPAQESLDALMETWDIEAEGGKKALLLSYFMKMHPELTFPSHTGPRLTGLLNYYRFQNIRLIAQFKKICVELKMRGIDFIVLKGGAMKSLRPAFPRVMNDIDILVRASDFNKVGALCRRLGYVCRRDRHAMSIHFRDSAEGMMDIHRYLDLKVGDGSVLNDDFFRRAVPAKVFGVDTLIPSREDMLFIALANLSKNLMYRTSADGLLFIWFDARFLTGTAPGFDYEIVLRDAEQSKSRANLLFAVCLLNSVVPDLLPEEIFEKDVPETEMEDFCALTAYARYILCPLQRKSHELGVRKVMRHPALIADFFKVRPLYTFLKMFRGRPAFAKKILARHETD
jgi:hypothetical protein